MPEASFFLVSFLKERLNKYTKTVLKVRRAVHAILETVVLAPGRRRDDPGPSLWAEGTGRKSYHHEGSRRMSTPTASLATAGTPGLSASSPPPKAGLPVGTPCPGLWGGIMEKHTSVTMTAAAIDIKPRCLLAYFLNVASDILDCPKTFFLFFFLVLLE